MEKIIKINPAYDKRATGNGIHNAEMFFVLKGDEGAVIFSTGTNWYLPETDRWMNSFEFNHDRQRKWRPRGNAVCYCSPKPMNEWQEREDGRENCDWLGCTCWGDCSYTTSDEVVEILISKGSDGVWEWLLNWYNEIFINKPIIEPIEATQ